MAQISLKIDDDVKHNVAAVCDELGILVSTAINIYLKKISREKRIPFDLSIDPFYSKENIKRLKKSAKQMDDNGGTIREIEGISKNSI